MCIREDRQSVSADKTDSEKNRGGEAKLTQNGISVYVIIRKSVIERQDY
jgi:hypothetical protein